jgi:hypothetical protein
MGIENHLSYGPVFGSWVGYDLVISDECQEGVRSWSELGWSDGGVGVNRDALFGQGNFRVVDYEVFKIVIE